MTRWSGRLQSHQSRIKEGERNACAIVNDLHQLGRPAAPHVPEAVIGEIGHEGTPCRVGGLKGQVYYH